jgi:hypothetical protein
LRNIVIAEQNWANLIIAVSEKFGAGEEASAPHAISAFFADLAERLKRDGNESQTLHEAFALLEESGDRYTDIGRRTLDQIRSENGRISPSDIVEILSKMLERTQSFLEAFQKKIVKVGKTNRRHLENVLSDQNENSAARKTLLEKVEGLASDAKVGAVKASNYAMWSLAASFLGVGLTLFLDYKNKVQDAHRAAQEITAPQPSVPAPVINFAPVISPSYTLSMPQAAEPPRRKVIVTKPHRRTPQ